MKRTNIHLTDEQIKRLGQLAKKTGLPIAEHIRRAIDEYLDRKLKDEHSHTDTDNESNT